MVRCTVMLFLLAGCVALTCRVLLAEETRVWKTADGRHSVEAEFVGYADGKVQLRRTAGGKVISVSLSWLSEADQDYIRSVAEVETNAGAEMLDSGVLTASELSRSTSRLTKSTEVLARYTAFLNNPKVPDVEKERAERQMKIWVRRAKKDRIRVGTDWMTAEEAEEAKKIEQELIEQVERLLQFNKGEDAREKLEEVSRANPASIRANFELAIAYGYSLRNPKLAEKHFRECIKRVELDFDQADVVSVNQMVALKNNLANAYFRQRKLSAAIREWGEAWELNPDSFTPRHNLMLMEVLAEVDPKAFGLREKKQVDDLIVLINEHNPLDEFSRSRGLYYSVNIQEPLKLTPGIRYDNATPTFRDNGCLGCNGDGMVKCGAQGCANGTVATKVVTVINGRQSGYHLKKSACNNCGGDGAVKCRRCRGRKTDPFFSSR